MTQTQIDMGLAVQRMAELVEAVPDDALGWPTPCERYSVGDLLDHVGGSAQAFRAAAVKQPLPLGDAANLGDDWRTRIPDDLRALAEAWRAPEAWTGMTAAGGVDLPGDVADIVAPDELVLHGWGLAKALAVPPVTTAPAWRPYGRWSISSGMGTSRGCTAPRYP